MTDKIFVDTNVWVYLYLHDDDEKYKIAEEYLSKNSHDAVFIITWQIMKNSAAERRSIFDREEKVLRTFLILYWGSAPRHPWLGIEPPQRGGVLDPPRINEVSNTLLRYKYKEIEIRKYIEQLCKTCTIQDFTKEIVLMASSLRERYSFSFWDSIIVGSALFSECNILISEDMQNGLNIAEKLIIRNVFLK